MASSEISAVGGLGGLLGQGQESQLDERQLRAICSSLGLPVHGTKEARAACPASMSAARRPV
jgi:hypothetical protein